MNLFDSFSPLNKTLKLFGILSFQMNAKCGRVEAVVSWRNILWTIGWLLILVVLLKYNLINGAHEPGEKSEVILLGWHWLLTFQLFSTFFIIFWNYYKRKDIGEFFQIINEFDENVSVENFNEKSCIQFLFIQAAALSIFINFTAVKNHMRNLIIGAVSILLTIIIFAFYLMRFYHDETYDIVLNIIFFYSTMVYVLVNYQFFFATFNIKLRFELLNDCLM